MTPTPSTSSRATRLLFFLFFCGLALTVLVFIDLQWTHRVLVKSTSASPSTAARP
jgi:hypothetical protein